MDQLCEKWIVTGRVQNVGFRYYSMRCAKHHGIAGAARNLPDGNVEIIALGKTEALELYHNDILKGPALSKVDSIERTPFPKQNYDSDIYDIVFTEE